MSLFFKPNGKTNYFEVTLKFICGGNYHVALNCFVVSFFFVSRVPLWVSLYIRQ